MLLAAVVGLLLMGPIPQPAAYHGFADTRAWSGIRNFSNVASNLPFTAAGVFGLWLILGPRGGEIFDRPIHRRPYVVLFLGVALVGAGSAYYHLAPDNARLVWDRLPITIAFMALTAAFIADRIHQRAGIRWLLPILVAAGMASVLGWYRSELLSRGDLRFYLLIQLFPPIVLPVICVLYRRARYTSGRHLAWLIAWYGAAKAFEHYDGEIYRLLGGAVSGHSLKHLAAAGAVVTVIRMLAASGKSPPSAEQ